VKAVRTFKTPCPKQHAAHIQAKKVKKNGKRDSGSKVGEKSKSSPFSIRTRRKSLAGLARCPTQPRASARIELPSTAAEKTNFIPPKRRRVESRDSEPSLFGVKKDHCDFVASAKENQSGT